MKKRIYFILIVVLLFSICIKNVSASELCSSNGYTVLTINGIFTDEKGAKLNAFALKYKLPPTYNNQPLKVDYLYNPTHLGGVGDLVDVMGQMIIDKNDDYDMVEVLNDASQKVTTQKLLLVGHSQGNFYANDLYDQLASQPGGVPSQSIGVYGVASPASRVAGEGKYITSDTDSIINSLIVKLINTYVLPPNIHIPLQAGDGNGHSFSDVYLKYQSDRIVSDIKSSLDKLKENDEQDPQSPCISAPELTLLHKVEGVGLASADFFIDSIKKSVIYVANSIYNTTLTIGNMINKLLANAVQSLPDASSVTTIPTDLSEPAEDNSSPVVSVASSTPNLAPLKETAVEEVGPSPVFYSGGGVGNYSFNDNEDNLSSSSSSSSGSGGGNSSANQQDTTGGNTNTTPDTIAPVISIIGDNPLNTTKGVTYTDAGATANDAVDGVLTVTTTGSVDTTTVGVYTITYTATDLSNNTVTATRTVNVVAPTPDTTPPIITLLGDDTEAITIGSTYIDPGATALDNVDGIRNVAMTGSVDNTKIGNYVITYTASDVAGNISTKTRNVIVASFKYVPEYSFGENNGDGHDWQVWAFNGSNVYDWTDTYVNNYLREQFKIQAYSGGFWCSQCLQRGIFTHDPQKGFEPADRTMSPLENNPQNNSNDITYNVAIQWDSAGYTYTISHNSVVDFTGHTDVSNMNNNLWVGWDGSFNNFLTFPSGNWQPDIHTSPVGRTGGQGMILQPFPVYKDQTVSAVSALSFPSKDLYAGNGINPTRGRTNLTPFDFQIIYTDKNNNVPQNVKLHITDRTTGISLPDVQMQKMSGSLDVLSDGNFTNGEAYITSGITYDTGDYDYYFSANDSAGNLMRIPENTPFHFGVIPSTYTYIPKYSFGTNNGDGNNWQIWSFNGSNISDWSDTYVNNYLKEQFKIQAYSGGFWCSQCLQRGIFTHDPQKGFETSDLSISFLENNPQNNENGVTYDVILQWDSGGYTYAISHDSIIDSTGHTDVAGMNNDLWVGWDGSFNNFKTFPSGNWQGTIHGSLLNRAGGDSMILQPYPVYAYSGPVLPVLSSAKQITAFNFTSITPSVTGVINETNHTISLTVPYNTDITNIIPTVAISSGASINPNNVAQNFNSSITYTVTAEDGTTQNYIVTVIVASNPNPPSTDTTPPAIASYTLNGGTGDVAINPTATSPLSIVLNASENVNWMTIKVENTNDSGIYKTFQSGAGCEDGTNTCIKNWEGDLSKGGVPQNGTTYKIKVHMQDAAKNNYEEYLPSLITISIPPTP